MTHPDSLLFDAAGARLAALPNGNGTFDRESRLLLYRTPVGPQGVAIVELATGRVTWVGSPHSSAIVYE